jgi:DNA-binding NarL/FixJ family response regulator
LEAVGMMSVLLADDERLERTFLRKILEQHAESYTVIGEAANGLQAVELALRCKPDIAILDISMPELNGLEARRKLKAMNPGIIVVLNSAYAEFQFAQKALEYKLDAYLVKPSNEHDILTTMVSLESHGDTPSPHDKFIFDGYVRYVGDEVVLVAAVDEARARKAADLVKVEYEVLGAVLDFETAIDNPVVIHPEPEIHDMFPIGFEPKRNIAAAYSMEIGDVLHAGPGPRRLPP